MQLGKMERNGNIAKTYPAVPLRTLVYDQLVDDITHGRINSGERLSEASLAHRFGVSQTPIREALIQLEREGYISLRRNIGAVVQKISVKAVNEIFTIVAVLESYATEIVTAEKRLTKGDITYLAKLIAEMKKRAQRKQYVEYRSLNVEFHGYFVTKLGNETLKLKVVDLRRRLYSLVAGGLTLPMNIDRYIECHQRILDAARENNALKAARLMRDHLMESKALLVAALEQEGSSP